MDRQAAWQLEGPAAERYQRLLVAPVTSVWAADLVEAAAIQDGERVLDVACGTGVVARAAALLAGPHGEVIGLDLNEDMLRVARSRALARGRASAAWARASPKPASWRSL